MTAGPLAVAGGFADYPLPAPRWLHPHVHAETVVTIAAVAVYLALFVLVARTARRDRDPVGVLLMLGALLAVVNDPLVEVAGRCYFATHLPVFSTMGRQMPLWGPFAYGILFGTETFLLYRLAQQGRLDLARLRLIVASTFLLDMAIEIPALQTHVYVYYGLQPFKVGGFPLYWVFVNTPSVVLGAAVLHRRRDWFAGRRAIGAGLVPILAIPASFYTAGLPVLAAMNSTLPPACVWCAAVLTAAVSLLVIEGAGQILTGVPAPDVALLTSGNVKKYSLDSGYCQSCFSSDHVTPDRAEPTLAREEP